MNIVKTIGIGTFGVGAGLIAFGVTFGDVPIGRLGVVIMLLGGLLAGVVHAWKEKK